MASLTSRTLKRTLLSVPRDQSQFVCNSCRSRFLSKQTRQLHASHTAHAEPRPQKTPSIRKSAQSNPPAPGSGPDGGKVVGVRRKRLGIKEFRDPEHVAAKTAEGLEWIGSKKWLERQRDPQDKFEGWAPKPVAIHANNVDVYLSEIKADVFGRSAPTFDEQSKARIQKSVAKITGIRLSDVQLQAAEDLPGLRRALMKERKELKFSEAFGKKRVPALQSLRNVSISGRRVTVVDKENERGRWKLIEKALRARGLPVFTGEAAKERRLL